MQDITTIHAPVLLQDCVDLVTPALQHKDAVVVDCTLGLAGHATAFLKAAPFATLIGIDRDSEALSLATERMRNEGLENRFIPAHAAFDEIDSVLNAHNIDSIDAAFMDLGLSSLQIDEADRGFSYSHDTALDMRMDTTQSTTAATILATYDARELTKIFREYGEERFASLIARRIVETREDQPLLTSLQLVRLVDDVIPKAHRATGNPAKRVFQALRIEVNGELDKLQRTLPKIALHLREHGRLVVESYHSLEDTTVKRFMNKGLTVDVPANMPVIPEDAQPFFKSLTRGAMKASKEEIEHNTRSSSVRLRAVELCRPIPNRWLNRLKDEAYGLEPRKGGR
ncbi:MULTISPECIES: 16S rRNA (cytosine(1402)-N(4))-methyltransferase RsmH [Gardnerella]|jgi:S-adenosyl-methyltransferase mraW|uniref:Ribosomal RNA small subunit methyltransferase H n=1 Tax=Gardnerella greenwoodii TaxID=2914925 RepID=A0A2N6RX02_9BIFI|nr:MULTISPECIES: 16S rRNA (cytosine(1402)-N(4))-methyltransferase RsmH [Gardnerella]EIK87378.1 Putative S-adenosylmethionine-dependent membrane protein [Gardnerella vaginalis 6119V5]MDF0753819.1 16S rRNA (cytosine(1402)-N(4))-methyltransferase RsmH [Gardnerella greenwoodii]PMC42640.1 16S rRNA (cytosine(1402)-N(4))-methyltransferase RsmH [Gardnerella greenwoodii]RIY18064.1 16S rRNA (cytosine(1402)-N(4))-methyltransferase RsmH [Bifidobacteriaceae bacterium WP012]